MRKNKVFFTGTFGCRAFYFYIFIRLGPCWGETGWQRILLAFGVFRKGGKLFVKHNFLWKGRLLPSFFYVLSRPPFSITISPLVILTTSITKLDHDNNTLSDKHLAETDAIYELCPYRR